MVCSNNELRKTLFDRWEKLGYSIVNLKGFVQNDVTYSKDDIMLFCQLYNNIFEELKQTCNETYTFMIENKN